MHDDNCKTPLGWLLLFGLGCALMGYLFGQTEKLRIIPDSELEIAE